MITKGSVYIGFKKEKERGPPLSLSRFSYFNWLNLFSMNKKKKLKELIQMIHDLYCYTSLFYSLYSESS